MNQNQNLTPSENLISNSGDSTEKIKTDLESTPVEDTNAEESLDSFDNMGLSQNLLRGVYAYGFERPSVIQQRAIVPFAKGHDLIAQAQSGTGKTGTYSIGLLDKLDYSLKATQAIILVPTRELAIQVRRVVQTIGDFIGVRTHACIGGTNVAKDVALLRSGPHVVVATPGRLLDMMRRKVLDPSDLRVIVLDEADEILSRGFAEDVQSIFEYVPMSKIQIGIFSATMPIEMLQLVETLLRDPVKIIVKSEDLTLRGIRQFFVDVQSEKLKFDTLCDLFSDISINMSVIFCNTRRTVETLTAQMLEEGYPVICTHSQLHGEERTIVMEKFRNMQARVLITTDLLARGIDVQQVSVVINYDLPTSRENYIHRIGRSGRFGRRGVAINFVTTRDFHVLKDIERFYATQVEPLPKNIAELI